MLRWRWGGGSILEAEGLTVPPPSATVRAPGHRPLHEGEEGGLPLNPMAGPSLVDQGFVNLLEIGPIRSGQPPVHAKREGSDHS